MDSGTEIITPEGARLLVREFLARVAAGTRFDSIFQNSVMNSVPFLQDRLHIITLISALCSPGTKVHACAVDNQSGNFLAVEAGRDEINRQKQLTNRFALDYEPGVLLSDFSKLPKIQKYHSPQEWRELWAAGFESVRVMNRDALVQCVCSGSKPVAAAQLAAAIRFEFDLPYPDGSRMGLVDEALQAFSQRLGLQLAIP